MTGIRLAREPLSKHQAEGILELRSKTGTDIIRILFRREHNYYCNERICQETAEHTIFKIGEEIIGDIQELTDELKADEEF